MNYRVDFVSIAWETLIKGLRHKVMKQGGKQLRLVEYTNEMAPHWCEKGHVGYVLEGQMEITFENGVLVLNAGDGIFIPSGREHRHLGRALSDVVKVIFVEDA
jgi:quercetin dioxygenase-like cupin family protein